MAVGKKKPQSIDEVLEDEPLTAGDEAALEAAKDEPRTRLANAALHRDSAIVQGAPDWALIPPNMQIPSGVEVSFMRIPLKGGGDVQLMTWELGVRDERMGRARADAGGAGARLVEEMAKQMIRAVDGKPISWGDPLEVERVWDKIGAKYRNLLSAYYLKLHQLDDEERLDFFENRVVARRSV